MFLLFFILKSNYSFSIGGTLFMKCVYLLITVSAPYRFHTDRKTSLLNFQRAIIWDWWDGLWRSVSSLTCLVGNVGMPHLLAFCWHDCLVLVVLVFFIFLRTRLLLIWKTTMLLFQLLTYEVKTSLMHAQDTSKFLTNIFFSCTC